MQIGKRIGLKYGQPTRNAFGEALREAGEKNPNLVVIDGDVGNSTRADYFGKAFPERYINVGIAESNLAGVASGLSAAGKDVVAASFAVFLLANAFDQIRMGIGFPNADVKLVGSHSGVSIGQDGPSQMAIEDLALASALPGFTVLAPADEYATVKATHAMLAWEGPVYMRTGRPRVPLVYSAELDYQIGSAIRVREGNRATIIACGLMVAAALEAAEILAESGIEVRVLDMHTIKPLDEDSIVQAARETGAIVTAEEHVLWGGLGSGVARVVAENHPVPMSFVGISEYSKSGTPDELLKYHGLMPEDIIAAVKNTLAKKDEDFRVD